MDNEARGGPPVNLDVFRETMRDAGVEDIVEPTIETYLEESAERIQSLEQAVKAREADTIEAVAHALKSASGAIMAERLAGQLQILEDAGARGDTDKAIDLFTETRREFDAVVEFLKRG